MIKLPRNYGTAILLAVLSGIFGLVLVGEWLHYRSLDNSIAERTGIQKAPPEELPEGPLPEPKQPLITSFDEMVNRPLFIQGRKPPEEDATEEVAAAPEPKTPLNAKLMGVVVTPGTQTVLMVDEKGKYKRARKNSVIDGWKLVEIKDDRVTMEQGGERKDLLLIKPKPKQPASGKPAADKQSGTVSVTRADQRRAASGGGVAANSDNNSGDEADDADTDTSDEDENDTTDEEDTGTDESTDEEQ